MYTLILEFANSVAYVICTYLCESACCSGFLVVSHVRRVRVYGLASNGAVDRGIGVVGSGFGVRGVGVVGAIVTRTAGCSGCVLRLVGGRRTVGGTR